MSLNMSCSQVEAASAPTYDRERGQRPCCKRGALLLQNLHAFEHLCLVHHLIGQLCTQHPFTVSRTYTYTVDVYKWGDYS